MRKRILICAVSLISFCATARPQSEQMIRVTKLQRSGVSESRTMLQLNGMEKGKCLVSIATALGRSDDKDAGVESCKSISKMIGKLSVARDQSYIRRYCPASYQIVEIVGKKEKFYCIKGKRSDGKLLVSLNKNLQAIAVRNLEVDF